MISSFPMKGDSPKIDDSKDYELFIDEYTIVDFTISFPEGGWPCFASTYTKNDTLYVDCSNFDAFMKSIKQESYFSFSMVEPYKILFGVNYEAVWAGVIVENSSNFEYPDKYPLIIEPSFDLESEETVYCRVIRTKGIFMKYRTPKPFIPDWDNYLDETYLFNSFIYPVFLVSYLPVDKFVILSDKTKKCVLQNINHK